MNSVFVWEYPTDELHRERQFILGYLNDFIKEYPFIVDKLDQLPVRVNKTYYDPDRR